MFFIFLNQLAISHIVTYGSAVQIKGLFTKNRITIELNQATSLPEINCRRPPYNDGWYWIVDSINESVDLARKQVACGSTITLHNPIFSTYLSVSGENERPIVATKLNNDDGKSHWEVICDGKDSFWEQDKAVQFYNKEENCFIQSGFESKTDNILEQVYKVKCQKEPSKETQWRASEGIYLDNEPISEMYANSPKN